MKLFDIIPECYVDTNVISTLIGADVNHQKGCNSVAKILNQKMSDRFAVGIIDKDKRTPGYLDQFQCLALRDTIELYKHPQRPHYFILVKPAIETLLTTSAKEAGIDLKNYNLPSNPELLTKYTKKIDSNTNPLFTRLVNQIKNADTMKSLSSTLTYLISHKYTVDTEELTQIFLS